MLGTTYETAWFLFHRLRRPFDMLPKYVHHLASLETSSFLVKHQQERVELSGKEIKIVEQFQPTNGPRPRPGCIQLTHCKVAEHLRNKPR